MRVLSLISLALALATVGCGPSEQAKRQQTAQRQAELKAESLFPNYPEVGKTYLRVDPFRGMQVTHFGNGKSWLWYPGNNRSLMAEWKTQLNERGQSELCFKYDRPNPNTGNDTGDGSFQCGPHYGLFARTVVAELPGDPFELTNGTVPYVLKKCEPPKEFEYTAERNSMGGVVYLQQCGPS